MKTATFNPSGGPIIAEIRSGFAQPGSYTLLLWEAGANVVVMRRDGNFINSADDSYRLPQPNEHNHQRLVQGIATIAIVPPLTDYQVDLIVSQDGHVLGGDTARGSNASGGVPVTLFVQLVSAGGAA
jgi:hypothetical protein